MSRPRDRPVSTISMPCSAAGGDARRCRARPDHDVCDERHLVRGVRRSTPSTRTSANSSIAPTPVASRHRPRGARWTRSSPRLIPTRKATPKRLGSSASRPKDDQTDAEPAPADAGLGRAAPRDRRTPSPSGSRAVRGRRPGTEAGPRPHGRRGRARDGRRWHRRAPATSRLDGPGPAQPLVAIDPCGEVAGIEAEFWLCVEDRCERRRPSTPRPTPA